MSKIDGRTIAANIEAVIRSVKRKKKRRRLLRVDENEPEVNNIADTLCARLKFKSISPQKDEPTEVMTDANPTAVVANVLEEKNESKGQNEENTIMLKKSNVFEMMMKARNGGEKKATKSIRKESMDRTNCPEPDVIIMDELIDRSVVTKRPRGRPKTKGLINESKICVKQDDISLENGKLKELKAISTVDARKTAAKRKASNVEQAEQTRKRAKLPEISVNDTEPMTNESPSLRPRRSCAQQSFTFLLDEDSHSNPPPSSPISSRKSLVKTVVKKSDMVKNSPKKVFKTVLDESQQKARKDFLMSGMPDQIKLEIERKQKLEQTIEDEYCLFPTYSHVPDPIVFIPSRLVIKLIESDFKFHFNVSCSTLKLGALTNCNSQKTPTFAIEYPVASIKQPKQLVQNLKKKYGNIFPVFRCYNQMTQKHRQFRPSPLKPKRRSAARDESLEIIEEDIQFQNGNVLFTEKYKPTALEHIIINMPPAIQLKEFLAPWLEGTESPSNIDSSFNDFDCSSNDSFRSFRSQNNACVLLGPISSGKTMTVYALAQEFKFNVLEINAGAKRTGKKILADLQEATQSHQIKSKGSAALFACENSSQSISSQSQSKKSLILIEDADIVFDQDDGFTSSLNVLVETSKRPVIFVANDENSPHLWKFLQMKAIRFKPPGLMVFSHYLSVMSIAEGTYIESDQIQKLYTHNKLDSRRTLLEMQFFIQSGGDRKHVQNHTRLLECFKKDQNSLGDIPTPSSDYNAITWDDKRDESEAATEVDWDSMTCYYDTISLSECLLEKGYSDIAQDLVNRIQWKRIERTSIIKRRSLSNLVNLPEVSSRNRILDYEPALRAICRSEKSRNNSETRRFYHHLRTITNPPYLDTKILDSYGSTFNEVTE